MIFQSVVSRRVASVPKVEFTGTVGQAHGQGLFFVTETAVCRVLLGGDVGDGIVGGKVPCCGHFQGGRAGETRTPEEMPEQPVGVDGESVG